MYHVTVQIKRIHIYESWLTNMAVLIDRPFSIMIRFNHSPIFSYSSYCFVVHTITGIDDQNHPMKLSQRKLQCLQPNSNFQNEGFNNYVVFIQVASKIYSLRGNCSWWWKSIYNRYNYIFYCEVICVYSRKENYRDSREAKNLSVSFLQIRKKIHAFS